MKVIRSLIFRISKVFAVAFLITMLIFPSITHTYIINHTFCKDVDQSKNPYEPIDPTNTFYDTDRGIIFLVILKDVRTSYTVYTKWFTPQGDLFTRAEESEWPYIEVEDPRSEGYYYWITYSLAFILDLQGDDSSALNSPGQWKVEFYVNDKLKSTDSFNLISAAPTSTTVTTSMLATTPVVTTTSILTETIAVTSLVTVTATLTETQQITGSTFITNPLGMIIIVLIIIVLALLIALIRRRKTPRSHHTASSNIYCANCGAPIIPGSTYCEQCGKPLK